MGGFLMGNVLHLGLNIGNDVNVIRRIMMIERDRFLTEAIGECWHEKVDRFIGNQNFYICSKCDIPHHVLQGHGLHPNYSAWNGFGKLWDWCLKQEWWDTFVYNNLPVDHSYVNPDKFSDILYKYLKEQKVLNVN
jgi:hypothetical protein